MGKASRRRKGADSGSRPARVEPAPFVARPFEGLPNETDWVAMREIVPAATATVRFAKGKAPEGAPDEVTIATVLPLAWPGLVAGSVLAFAKALGEFGATITFVSNIPGETRTLPLAIYSALQVPGGEAMVTRLALLSVALSLGALILSEYLVRRTHGGRARHGD